MVFEDMHMYTKPKLAGRNPTASKMLFVSLLALSLGMAKPSFALDVVNLHISA